MRRGVLTLSLSVCLVLSLMSKPMLVTLPFVMLLLDYWPLGRFRPIILTLAVSKGPHFSESQTKPSDFQDQPDYE